MISAMNCYFITAFNAAKYTIRAAALGHILVVLWKTCKKNTPPFTFALYINLFPFINTLHVTSHIFNPLIQQLTHTAAWQIQPYLLSAAQPAAP